MGGFGSGRDEYATTPTVERCRHLNVDKITDIVEQSGKGSMVYWGGQDDPDASIRVVALSREHVAALEAGDSLQIQPADAETERDPETKARVDTTGVATGGDSEDGSTPEDDVDERAVALLLVYRVIDHRADETRQLRYLVPIEYTECHFGGTRPWFRCPGPDGRTCGERVGKLYGPPRGDRYLCRECYDLGYQSSRSSGNEMDRAEQRYRKAFAKADAENRRPHPNNSPWFPERPTGMHHDTFEDLVDDVRQASREWHDAMENRLWSLAGKYDYDLPRPPSTT